MAKILVIRIKEAGTKGRGCYEYKNEINLSDFKQLSEFLSDLEIYGGKVEKAFLEFKKEKEWPFS